MRFEKILTSWSIRTKLLLLIVAVFLPGAGVIIHDGLENRKKDLQAAKRDATLLVDTLAAQQEKIAMGTKQMLSTLARLPQVRNLDAEACSKLFRELIEHNPLYYAVGASTPDGTMFANNRAFESGTVNIAGQKHVRDALETRDFSVGEYVIGKITRVPSLHYAYPVLDENERLIAVVTAAFRLSEYDALIRKASLPPDSSVLILDHRGVRLYRYPESDAAPLGRPPTIGFDEIGDRDEGTYERNSDDGIYQLFAFKRLRLTEDAPPYLLIAVGIPKDKILQKANIAMLNSLLFLFTAAVVAACLAWFLGNLVLIRPLNHLVAATQEFGSGRMDARTGLPHTPDELGKLAQSFDNMAALLEQRNMQRKKSAQELIRLYRQNQLILNAAGEGIIGLDENGTITFANPAAREILGYDEEELIGRDLHRTIHRVSHDGTLQPLTECPVWLCLHKGVSGRVRDQMLWRKDGTSFPAAYSSTPILEDGRVVGAVVTFRDRSAYKRAEEALQKSEHFVRRVIETTPNLLYIYDLAEKRNIYMNRETRAFFGYGPEEVQTLGWFSSQSPFHPDDLPVIEAHREALSKAGEGDVRGMEFRARHASGEWRWLTSHEVVFARSPEGAVTQILGSAQDITQRKRMEEALGESVASYKALAENLPGIVYRSFPGGQGMLFFNEMLESITGYTSGELASRGIFGMEPLILEEDRQRVAAAVGNALKERKPFEVSYRLRHKNGSTKHCFEHGRPIYDEGGEFLHVEGVIFDTTERLHLENHLRQAQKMEAIGTLAGGIAHDFNNILAAILIYTQMVLREIPESNPAHADLQQVVQSSLRAKELVKQILAFSRQTEEEKKHPLIVGSIIKEAIQLLRASLPSTIEIRQKIASREDAALIDPTQIHQVLMNLCTNAAHAMREHGGVLEIGLTKVRLGAEEILSWPDLKPGQYLQLTVSDTGHGMHPDTLQQIFDPYFTTKEPGEGTGLGLAVVHGIVKKHGGAVRVRSELGKGSTFDVLIPVIEGDFRESLEEDADMPGGNERILLVDDEEALLLGKKRLFEKLGYGVVAAGNGREALEAFQSRPDHFDLVVTDCTMPHMTGFDLAREIKGIRPDIPIVLSTGGRAADLLEKAREAGILEVATKPLDLADLARMVRRILDQVQVEEEDEADRPRMRGPDPGL